MSVSLSESLVLAQQRAAKQEFKRELIDIDGENRAVRAFLMLYGQVGVTAKSMARHMEAMGFPHYPDWIHEAPGHLTKGGAQLWLRLLFDLEKDL